MSLDPFTRVALRFPMPLDSVDWQNLRTSGCRLVQLPWAQALHRLEELEGKPTQLAALTGAGYGVILRMDEEDAVHRSADQLRVELGARLSETHGRGLDAVIVFNEPDIDSEGKPYDLTKGSASWHQAEAKLHCIDTANVVGALGGRVRLVAAPLSNRHQSEDGKAEPGLLEWWTELRPIYHDPRVAGVGVHIYEQFLSDDPGSIDTDRLKDKLWLWGTLWQPELWMDELAITHGTPMDRMRGFISGLRWLEKCPENIELASLFASNGTGVGYDAAYIIRDPACYALLGKFLSGR